MGEVSFIDKTIKKVKQHLNNTYMTIFFTKTVVVYSDAKKYLSQSLITKQVASKHAARPNKNKNIIHILQSVAPRSRK